jgi:hypothetical protein
MKPTKEQKAWELLEATIIHEGIIAGSLERAGSVPTVPSLCETREGIGLCDECAKPKWPQRYMGYGCMVCLDCLAAAERKALNAEAERPAGRKHCDSQQPIKEQNANQ